MRISMRNTRGVTGDEHFNFLELRHRVDDCGKVRHWLAEHDLCSHKKREKIQLYDLAILEEHYQSYILSKDIVSEKLVYVPVRKVP